MLRREWFVLAGALLALGGVATGNRWFALVAGLVGWVALREGLRPPIPSTFRYVAPAGLVALGGSPVFLWTDGAGVVVDCGAVLSPAALGLVLPVPVSGESPGLLRFVILAHTGLRGHYSPSSDGRQPRRWYLLLVG